MNEPEKEFYAGGGSTLALVKMRAKEILRVTEGKIRHFSTTLK